MSEKVRKARMLRKPEKAFEPPYWATYPPAGLKAVFEMYKEEGRILKYYHVGHGEKTAKKRAHVFGREKGAADIILDHPSISRVHAAVIHCLGKECGGAKKLDKKQEETDFAMCIVDLHSTHGTRLNGKALPKGLVVRLWGDDVIKFGGSERKYKLKGLPKRPPKRAKEEKEEEVDEEEQPEESKKDQKKKKRKRENGDDDSTSHEEKLKGIPGEEQGWVKVSHILVKHKGSRRPSSWLEELVTRTDIEALKMIKEYRSQIINGERRFKDIAKECSHCNSSKKGGDLGKFGQGKMQPAFEKAAFDLDLYELSKPVFSDSGVHLILRTQ